MGTKRKIFGAIGIVGGLLLLAAIAFLVWFASVILKGLSGGDCPPAVERVNAVCAHVEGDGGLHFKCHSPTGTREWAACERRDHFYLSWEPAPDSGAHSDPYATGWVSEGVEIADGGPWSCSNGEQRLSVYASSIPSGEEERAALAFGKACARLNQR